MSIVLGKSLEVRLLSLGSLDVGIRSGAFEFRDLIMSEFEEFMYKLKYPSFKLRRSYPKFSRHTY